VRCGGAPRFLRRMRISHQFVSSAHSDVLKPSISSGKSEGGRAADKTAGGPDLSNLPSPEGAAAALPWRRLAMSARDDLAASPAAFGVRGAHGSARRHCEK
jgi:hypothetical protein